MRRSTASLALLLVAVAGGDSRADYTNFEASHVHPIALTPSGARLLVINTPDATLEVFAVQPDGGLVRESSIPVGLEPVSVAARNDSEAWVVNHLSDSVSVVDLNAAIAVETLDVGDEPSDVVFAAGKAFVAVSQEDVVRVFDADSLGTPPVTIPIFGRKPRALAVSPDGNHVYAVVLFSGNRTTLVAAHTIFDLGIQISSGRLAALGLEDVDCSGSPPAYPPLPPGIVRNPALVDPPSGVPRVGLIVRWNPVTEQWEDDAGQDWTGCLPYRLPDHDLFVIDSSSLSVATVDHLGTSLFEVSVNPADGRIYVPHTDARNFVRFEHVLGADGHVVDNRLAVVDPSAGNATTLVDLNSHIDRDSDPSTNLAERLASVSQPGMMAWTQDGTRAFLTSLGSRKVFEIDGACLDGDCIFGPDRAVPRSVPVAEGPSGVALHEEVERLYVLSRFTNSLTLIDSSSLARVGEVALHDPQPNVTRAGRRFLYDAILGSGHGDAACSSCHISGDRDDLSWDLGNPEGDLVPYATPQDNVRFVTPQNGNPTQCDPTTCSGHDGFDPQKGPMSTQTLRGMLEPLHWRGDKPTMNDFNGAFVGLLGTADMGSIGGASAGLSVEDMEAFRQFALRIEFPPNPHRNVDDTLPDSDVPVVGTPFAGNPADGKVLFDTAPTDVGEPCVSCHSHPFGAAGGTRFGVEPQEPTSLETAAVFTGGPLHSDLKVPHLRNLYERVGPVFGEVGQPAMARAGYGVTHDGGFPDLGTLLSLQAFAVSASQARDLAAFVMHFPTETRPAIGRQVTLPPGQPPTGLPVEESLLDAMLALGDEADPERHCELTAVYESAGRVRRARWAGGVWHADTGGEVTLPTKLLRESATGPITFLCATVGAGVRLGGDRDEDGVLDGDDCAVADSGSLAPPGIVDSLLFGGGSPRLMSWNHQSPAVGSGVRYDVVSGTLSDLHTVGLATATTCLVADLPSATLVDPTPMPTPGDGRFFLVLAENACGVGGWGSGRESLALLTCHAPSPSGIPPTADGGIGGGVAMSARRSASSPGEILVDWDVSTCPAPDYHLVFGDSMGLPTYSYTGAFCSVGNDGTTAVALPDPDPGRFVWWILAGADGATESSHGFRSNGAVRPATANPFCGISDQDAIGTCL